MNGKAGENLAGGIDFSTTLCKTQSFIVFFWLLRHYLGSGWGLGLLCQLQHAVLWGTSWKLHCMDLLCHRVCFFKQFDILSRQQPGKFAFQMQFLWAPISMWPISAPCSNYGPNQNTFWPQWLSLQCTWLSGFLLENAKCSLLQTHWATRVMSENSAQSKISLIFFLIPGFFPSPSVPSFLPCFLPVIDIQYRVSFRCIALQVPIYIRYKFATHKKSGYHLSPYLVVTIFLTIFSMLQITSLYITLFCS